MKKLTIIILFTTLNFSLLSFNSYSQWYQVNLPVTGQIQQVQFFNTNTGWAMVKESAVKFTLLKTVNGGTNWSSIYSDSTKVMKFQFINDTLGYGIGMSYIYDFLLKTTNGGYNWSIMQSTTNYVYGGFYFINADTGYINGFNMSYYTFRTTNGLQTIDLISSGAGGSPASIWFYKYPYNGNLCGYISGGGNLWRTTNSGYNWSQLVLSGTVYGFSFINKDTGWVNLNFENSFVYRTTNSGTNWYLQYQNNRIGNVYAVNINRIWCGVDNYYVLASTDGGLNWGRQYTTLFSNYHVYLYDTSLGFIYSGPQLLRTTNGGGPILPVNKISEKVPDNYELSQNYPNPFNPATNIEFSIPQNSIISLQIFDILGRKVSDVISSAEYSAGEYRANIDFSNKNLSGGIYLCRLTAYQKNSGKTTTITKKMIYNK